MKVKSCSVCTKAFARAEHLNRHILTHSKEKPFQCSVCQKPFARLDALKRHQKTHTKTPTKLKTMVKEEMMKIPLSPPPTPDYDTPSMSSTEMDIASTLLHLSSVPSRISIQSLIN